MNFKMLRLQRLQDLRLQAKNYSAYSAYMIFSRKSKTTAPRNPLFGVLYIGKSIYLGRMSEETRFPYMGNTRDLCSSNSSSSSSSSSTSW